MDKITQEQLEQLTAAIQEKDPGARVYWNGEWICLERGEEQFGKLKDILGGERTRAIGKSYEVACAFLDRIYNLHLSPEEE